MATRRAFVRHLAAAVPAPAFGAHALRHALDAGERGGGGADDEAYWREIRRAFDLDPELVNLNNGGVSPSPAPVLEAMIRDLRFSNLLPVEHMWRTLEPRVEAVREALAAEFGCGADELAITRNASEALETLTFGLDLRRGDEVVVSTQNYPRMLTAWDQRARRDGVVVRRVQFAVPPPSPEHVAGRFLAAVTPRTRVVEVPHITNLSGHILPVRALVDALRPHGVHVVVDGAHAFAHFPFTRDALGCDFYGTSLHKWLLAPVGTGFLYVRRARIPAVWPLMAAPAAMDGDIRKFEEVGTHPAANHNAIAVALAFHRAIGAERKAARLAWLRRRWSTRLRDEGGERVRLLTEPDTPHAVGLGMVSLEGVDPHRLGGWLVSRHRIVATPIVYAELSGLRVTPNVYTTPEELDRFVDAMLVALRRGIG